MSDEALIAWLNGGAVVALPEDEAAAKRHQSFSLRFSQALNPDGDLGPTDEAHQAAIASNVFVVHHELCALGEDEYSMVWRTLSAPTRAALKIYIVMAGKDK